MTADELIAAGRAHEPELEPGQFVIGELLYKSDKDNEFNKDAYLRGMITANELYWMSRPIAVVGSFEEKMRKLRGLPEEKVCVACGLTAEEGCSH